MGAENTLSNYIIFVSNCVMNFRLNRGNFTRSTAQINNAMKNFTARLLALFVVLFSFTSCEVIGDIFKAGMGVGIFLVILVIALIVWAVSRFKK
jgi:hypothetical protein